MIRSGIMEVSDLRRRIRAAIEAARVRAVDRRARTDSATRAYEPFLEAIGVPAFHTLANALVGEGHRFKVTTPGQAVRLTAERSAEDFIEMALDTDRDVPAVVLVAQRGRGRRMVSAERILREGPDIASLTEEDVVSAVIEELVPLIER
jgi:hypothetical protein